jgi:hypothetical protein
VNGVFSFLFEIDLHFTVFVEMGFIVVNQTDVLFNAEEGNILSLLVP